MESISNEDISSAPPFEEKNFDTSPLTALTNGTITEKWNRIYHNNTYDYGYGVWVNDTEVYGVGICDIPTKGVDATIVKWHVNGTRAWVRMWGLSGWDYFNDVWSDGVYIYTVGSTSSIGAGNYDILLAKWDGSGRLIWNKTWGDSRIDNGNEICGDSTGIYIVGTYDYDGATLNTGELLIAKFDFDGNELWNFTWDGNRYHEGLGIAVDSNAVYAVGDRYYANYDLVLIKCDLNGNFQWNRTYIKTGTQKGYDVWLDSTGIYTGGDTSTAAYNFLLIKWNYSGDVLWDKTWGGTNAEHGYALWGTEGVIFQGGSTASDMAIVAWNGTTGDIMDNTTFGNTGGDICYSMGGNRTTLYTFGVYALVGGAYENFGLVRYDMNQIPIANFTVDTTLGIPGDELHFTFTGALGENPNTFEWNFGDGSLFSSQTNPSHTYSLPGLYSVTLKITDTDGHIGFLNKSEWIEIYIPKPNTPVLNLITPSVSPTGRIDLSWNAVDFADNYTVYRHSAAISALNLGDADMVASEILPNSYQDNHPTEGIWWYAVLASNRNGSSDLSNSRSVTVDLPNATAPSITLVSSTPSLNGTVRIAWNGDPFVDNYTVFRYSEIITPANMHLAQIVATGLQQTEFSQIVATNGTYWYAIVARNETGTSNISNNLQVTVTLLPPVTTTTSTTTTTTTSPTTTSTTPTSTSSSSSSSMTDSTSPTTSSGASTSSSNSNPGDPVTNSLSPYLLLLIIPGIAVVLIIVLKRKEIQTK